MLALAGKIQKTIAQKAAYAQTNLDRGSPVSMVVVGPCGWTTGPRLGEVGRWDA